MGDVLNTPILYEPENVAIAAVEAIYNAGRPRRTTPYWRVRDEVVEQVRDAGMGRGFLGAWGTLVGWTKDAMRDALDPGVVSAAAVGRCVGWREGVVSCR